jgi:CheY-like chemotaxis protein
VDLIIEADPALPPIHADPGQIQQVIMNLIINAAESFEEGRGGSIRVSTSRQDLDRDFFLRGEAGVPGKYVLLTVADDGSGMDEATQSRIFEPFYTTKFMGRGLGLAAVHGIVSGHNGVLRLESAPARGTTFRLYFPLSAGTAAGSVREERRSRHKRTPVSGTVLVIDDESAVRNFAKHSLETLGYRVLTASDGKSGVELFREVHAEVDVVLLDFTMPGMNGDQAFEQLRLVSPDVPVVLSSGFTESVVSERFKGKKLNGFLSKPFTAPQIGVVVKKALSWR